jgi:hypothetical protein
MSLDLADFERQFKGFFEDLIESGIDAPVADDTPKPTLQLLDEESNG